MTDVHAVWCTCLQCQKLDLEVRMLRGHCICGGLSESDRLFLEALGGTVTQGIHTLIQDRVRLAESIMEERWNNAR